MRHLLIFALLLFFAAALPSPAQTTPGPVYSITKGNVFRVSREDEETKKPALFVTIQFQIHKLNDDGTRVAVLPADVTEEFIVVKENGVEVKRLKLTQLRNEALTTVLVLDHSGSMRQPADDTDTVSKIDALKNAAARFIDKMPDRTRTALLPFSSTVQMPESFGADKARLKAAVRGLKPEGGTLLYDAAYAGVETLAAARPAGTKVVILLTDGRDEQPGSRHTPDELIARAREADVRLYTLGFGREREINEKVLRELAEKTGGKYNRAANQERLYELFDLLVTEVQTDHTVTFLSRDQNFDGTARGIDISIERGGETISNVAQTNYEVHGVVVAQRDSAVYLSLLVLLGGLLLVPTGVRKMYRAFGGK
jgi:VWFA-related protein